MFPFRYVFSLPKCKSFLTPQQKKKKKKKEKGLKIFHLAVWWGFCHCHGCYLWGTQILFISSNISNLLAIGDCRCGKYYYHSVEDFCSFSLSPQQKDNVIVMTFLFIFPITANTVGEIKSRVVRVEGKGERNVSNYLARNWILAHSWDGPNPKPQIWTSSDLGKTRISMWTLWLGPSLRLSLPHESLMQESAGESLHALQYLKRK